MNFVRYSVEVRDIGGINKSVQEYAFAVLFSYLSLRNFICKYFFYDHIF